MSDWQYAQTDKAEELAQVHHFTMKKREGEKTIEFRIVVKEYAAPPPGQSLRFFAEADKHVNQKSVPVLPSGWGDSLLKALADCLRMIRQFPYEA
ncbi:MAG TPA: hypothetical protein VMU43_12845 [Candidatus Acidoferrum sp.]|nr:hypothetical protein [Candidatus Acidoferrum sp.]